MNQDAGLFSWISNTFDELVQIVLIGIVFFAVLFFITAPVFLLLFIFARATGQKQTAREIFMASTVLMAWVILAWTVVIMVLALFNYFELASQVFVYGKWFIWALWPYYLGWL